MKYVLVAVERPLDETFLYRTDEKHEGESLFGRRVEVPFGNSKTIGYVIKDTNSAGAIEEKRIRKIIKVIDKEPLFGEDILSLAAWMSEMYLTSLGENLSLMIPSARRVTKSAIESSENPFRPIERLTDDQRRALGLLRERDDGIFYLFGVTGSGKSEVYLRRAEDIIARGKQVLHLVPEIALTNQISDEVKERFKGRVEIIHSALTEGERLRAWRKIQKGETDLVIGARSAVFAPFSRLGLIILDEEHDQSYKSGQAPRYHARQVAERRARTSHAQFVMGSATPSVEAWQMMFLGRIKRIDMPRRIGEGAFPKTRLINILHERRNISPELEEAIRQTLHDKKQVMLFLNRRGFGYSYVCKACGHIITCPNCSVTLTYHEKKHRLVCHTCGYSEAKREACPVCSSLDIEPRGFGTENAEDEVRHLFPGAKIERLDGDVALESKGRSHEILERFSKGETDILLGTQMITKGLNIQGLGLVGILNADSTLTIPDFRSGERTFNLLTQVSGRVGRYRDDGLVIVQAISVMNPVITHAVNNEIEEFYLDEIEERRKTGFPPFTRLVDFTVRGRDRDRVIGEARHLEDIANGVASFYEIDVFSADRALVEMKAKQYRWHVLIRADAKEAKSLLRAARHIKELYKPPGNIYLEIDVDPASMI